MEVLQADHLNEVIVEAKLTTLDTPATEVEWLHELVMYLLLVEKTIC